MKTCCNGYLKIFSSLADEYKIDEPKYARSVPYLDMHLTLVTENGKYKVHSQHKSALCYKHRTHFPKLIKGSIAAQTASKKTLSTQFVAHFFVLNSVFGLDPSRLGAVAKPGNSGQKGPV